MHSMSSGCLCFIYFVYIYNIEFRSKTMLIIFTLSGTVVLLIELTNASRNCRHTHVHHLQRRKSYSALISSRIIAELH